MLNQMVRNQINLQCVLSGPHMSGKTQQTRQLAAKACLGRIRHKRMNVVINEPIQYTKLDRRMNIRVKTMTGASVTCEGMSSSQGGATQEGTKPELPALDEDYGAKLRFSHYANWLIPGVLMTGRYPFVEPSRCRTHDEGEKMLEELIDAGIDTFYCLQGELPPQEEIPLKGVDGFLPYRATATLIASAKSDPPSVEEINGLRTQYLDKYLPPRRKQVEHKRRIIELDFVHNAITDLGVPKQQQLEAIVNDLAARIQKGQVVYLHCWGGRGRAGTVGAAFLASLYGLSAEQALERVQKAFDTRNDGGRKSPETNEQIEFVTDFVKRLQTTR